MRRRRDGCTNLSGQGAGPPDIVLSPHTSDVNTNAYYFVEVGAVRGNAAKKSESYP